MYRNPQHRREQRGLSPQVIFLLINVYQQLQRLPVKPPITIGLLFINIATFVLPNANFLDYDLTNIQQNCILPKTIITNFYKYGELNLNRILFSSIIHADDVHLYYNMTSLCWKGISLEISMGSQSFLGLVIFSLIASHSIMIFLSYTLTEILRLDPNITGYNSCAVGFSAVLFALKYVLNYYSPANTVIMGISVPTKHAAWLELVTISIMNPSASFIGHLSGIIAGMLYVHIPHLYIIVTTLLSNNRPRPSSGSSSGSSSTRTDSNYNRSYTYASGTIPASNPAPPISSNNNYNNTSNYNNSTTMPASSATAQSEVDTSTAPTAPSAADMRRERMRHYKAS